MRGGCGGTQARPPSPLRGGGVQHGDAVRETTSGSARPMRRLGGLRSSAASKPACALALGEDRQGLWLVRNISHAYPRTPEQATHDSVTCAAPRRASAKNLSCTPAACRYDPPLPLRRLSTSVSTTIAALERTLTARVIRHPGPPVPAPIAPCRCLIPYHHVQGRREEARRLRYPAHGGRYGWRDGSGESTYAVPL